jgi:hypothetical protein
VRARHTLPQAKDFIRRLLVLAAAARMTMVEALAHPWLAAVGAEEDGGGRPRHILTAPAVRQW